MTLKHEKMHFEYIQSPSLIKQNMGYIQINYDEISIKFCDKSMERDFYLVI